MLVPAPTWPGTARTGAAIQQPFCTSSGPELCLMRTGREDASDRIPIILPLLPGRTITLYTIHP